MSATRVLIFEDDQTQREALKLALVKNGSEVYATDNEAEARDFLEKKEVQVAFVDCLLPGLSGVDFVESIRKRYPADILKVILMSGIFTDSGFVKDATRSTQAVGFLKKPFDLKEVFSLVPKSETTSEEVVSPRKLLYQMFSRGKVSVREKRKLIESLDEIHGYDLPFIYSLLVESKMSGHLNIVSPAGEVSGISFSQGVIVGVDIADKETYLGKLLIESGYILPDDLKDALGLKSAKKIGERLIQGNLLSPHAFSIVLSNQMNIRLSRTIVNSQININFVETDIETTVPNIDSDALVSFQHDWIAGKITLDWLKTHYTQWGSHTMALGSNLKQNDPACKLPLIVSLDNFLEKLTSGSTLSQILDSQIFPEEAFYKALHFVLSRGFVVFSEKVRKMEIQDISKLLKKISAQFQGKNKLEIFDLMARMTNSTDSDPQKVLNYFLMMLGDPVTFQTMELKLLRAQIEKIAKEAYEFSKSGDREKLRQEMEKNEIEFKLKAANQFEEAKNCLQRAQFSVALPLLQKALAVDPGLSKLKIYLAWAKLGLLESGNNKKINLKEIEMDLLQVSPEDKFDAIFHFVMGLYYRSAGEIGSSKRAFEKSLNMDSSMIVARRELTKTTAVNQPKKDMLNRDLKDLVSGFFAKKK